jgi:hypothetical protein
LVRMLVVCQIVATVPPAFAADRTTQATVLQVNVTDSSITELPGNRKGKLLDVNEFELRRRETVAVDLLDPNPLLFEYETVVTEAETEQHKVAAEFAKTLAALMAGFKAGGGSDGVILVEGLNLGALRGRLQLLSSQMNDIGAQIAKSLGSVADVEQMKATVREWKVASSASALSDDLQKVAAIAGKCLAGAPLTTNSEFTFMCTSPLADAEKPVDTLRAERALREQQLREAAERAAREAEQQRRNAPAARRPANPPAATQPRPVNPPLAPIVPGAPPIAGGTQPPAPGGAPPGTQLPPAPGTSITPPAPVVPAERIIDFITLIEARRTDLQNSLTVLRGFASDVEEVLKVKTLTTRPHSIQAQTIAVTIKPSPKYEAFLDPGTKKRRDSMARKFSVVLEPYSPALISLSPAMILLFIDNPTFKAVKKGEQFVIEKSDDEVTAYNLAAMLNITPRSWSEPTFGGALQIGVSPTKNKIGFYAGGGISVQDVFWFGGGVTWQEVDRLSGSLATGQTIASPDDLKTTTHFKPGFYLHITAKLK